MSTFDFDLDLFIKSFTDAGAVITKGTGKIIVDGEETDIVSSIKRGLNDFVIKKQEVQHATVSFDASTKETCEGFKKWPATRQIMIAA